MAKADFQLVRKHGAIASQNTHLDRSIYSGLTALAIADIINANTNPTFKVVAGDDQVILSAVSFIGLPVVSKEHNLRGTTPRLVEIYVTLPPIHKATSLIGLPVSTNIATFSGTGTNIVEIFENIGSAGKPYYSPIGLDVSCDNSSIFAKAKIEKYGIPTTTTDNISFNLNPLIKVSQS